MNVQIKLAANHALLAIMSAQFHVLIQNALKNVEIHVQNAKNYVNINVNMVNAQNYALKYAIGSHAMNHARNH